MSVYVLDPSSKPSGITGTNQLTKIIVCQRIFNIEMILTTGLINQGIAILVTGCTRYGIPNRQ
jgi:hypothetical protein